MAALTDNPTDGDGIGPAVDLERPPDPTVATVCRESTPLRRTLSALVMTLAAISLVVTTVAG